MFYRRWKRMLYWRWEWMLYWRGKWMFYRRRKRNHLDNYSIHTCVLNYLRRVCDLYFHFSGNFLVLKMKRDRIFELLYEILIDWFPTLKDWASIFEALDLLKNEARGVNFVLNGSVDGDDALLGIFFSLSIWEYFDLCTTGPFDNIFNHVAL